MDDFFYGFAYLIFHVQFLYVDCEISLSVKHPKTSFHILTNHYKNAIFSDLDFSLRFYPLPLNLFLKTIQILFLLQDPEYKHTRVQSLFHFPIESQISL